MGNPKEGHSLAGRWLFSLQLDVLICESSRKSSINSLSYDSYIYDDPRIPGLVCLWCEEGKWR